MTTITLWHVVAGSGRRPPHHFRTYALQYIVPTLQRKRSLAVTVRGPIRSRRQEPERDCGEERRGRLLALPLERSGVAISATPEPTASSTSKAGTTSPAADTVTSSRPPDSAPHPPVPHFWHSAIVFAFNGIVLLSSSLRTMSYARKLVTASGTGGAVDRIYLSLTIPALSASAWTLTPHSPAARFAAHPCSSSHRFPVSAHISRCRPSIAEGAK